MFTRCLYFTSQHRKFIFTSGDGHEWKYISMISSEKKSYTDWHKFSVSLMLILNENI